jgi:RNA polymerase sigma factor (sigma-70 family)
MRLPPEGFGLSQSTFFCQHSFRMRAPADNDPDNARAVPREFPDTRWSQVVLAGGGNSAGAWQALGQLCESYWQPIYGFLRRKGHAPHDAEDLTQQFFVRLLQHNSVANANRLKGRFRSFLLGALSYFLTDELRKNSALKRGGPTLPFATDFSDAEERYLEQPDPNLTPEEMYDRRWAATLLQQAFDLLAGEFEAAGFRVRFDQLKPFLASQPTDGDYDRLAPQLGMTPRAVGAAVYRMRQRYRQMVRNQVAETVAANDQIDAELTQLFG